MKRAQGLVINIFIRLDIRRNSKKVDTKPGEPLKKVVNNNDIEKIYNNNLMKKKELINNMK